MGVCNATGRIAICHKNVPAVISKITSIFADAGINIEEMANKSRGEYAYSLFDVDKAVDENVVERLATLDGIIKVRIVK